MMEIMDDEDLASWDNESLIDGTCGDIAANSIPSSSHRSKSMQDSDNVSVNTNTCRDIVVGQLFQHTVTVNGAVEELEIPKTVKVYERKRKGEGFYKRKRLHDREEEAENTKGGYLLRALKTWKVAVEELKIEKEQTKVQAKRWILLAACCGNCNCRSCLQVDPSARCLDNQELKIDQDTKVEYCKCLVHQLLPFLELINDEQVSEIVWEANRIGLDVLELKINKSNCSADERIYYDICSTSIFDLHRSCSMCPYDLCLKYCQEIRDENLKKKVAKFKANGDESILCLETHIKQGLELTYSFSKNHVGKLVEYERLLLSKYENLLVRFGLTLTYKNHVGKLVGHQKPNQT
ncbi:hypothetical protein M0R45_001406 [Rubus argutus]|uniref:Uncharacterized protein n=1 Tax=Rubus argutus TaxID=59490 RepID=A0AAW1VHJ4_RUBAR